MAVISFYLDTRRAKKDGTFPVKLYVNHHKKFYVKTTFSAAEENWEGCQFSKYEPNYKAKNMAIRALLNRAEEVIFGLEREGRLKSISDENGVSMPSFFGYMLWSLGFLIPLFLLDTLIFFL